jgi:polysaccharide pyruvyl transferase WcaK-like protein
MTDARHDALTREMRFLAAPDPDSVFLDDMLALIDRARARGPRRRARDGTLRILLLGYVGAGNTGADVRAIEVIRQLRCTFSGRRLALTLLGFGELYDHPELAGVTRFAPSPPYLPDALDSALPGFDMVLNVEGSTYTSRFSDALAGSLIGGVSLADAHGALACAYGVDTGTMSARLETFVASSLSGALVYCRSRAALERLGALGSVPCPGADPAWRYRTAPHALLPALPPRYAVLCPNNPYWWPVVTDVHRAFALQRDGVDSPLRHGPFTFHSWDSTRAHSFERYALGYATLAHELRRRGIEPVLVAMERGDAAACEAIAARLTDPPRIVARPRATIDAVLGTLARACCVVTTRYHAALFAMSHSVPVFGVSMDERIVQLFDDARLSECAFACDDPLFAQRVLERIDVDALQAPERLVRAYATLSGTQLERLDQMAAGLSDSLEQREAG